MVLKERKDLEFFLGSVLCFSFFFFFLSLLSPFYKQGG